MSDNILKLIPVSPIHIPTGDLIQKTLTSIELLFPTADKMSVKQNALPQFIDPETNLERIICPRCGKIN